MRAQIARACAKKNELFVPFCILSESKQCSVMVKNKDIPIFFRQKREPTVLGDSHTKRKYSIPKIKAQTPKKAFCL